MDRQGSHSSANKAGYIPPGQLEHDTIEMETEDDHFLEPISSVRDGSNPWEKCVKLSKKYDDETCEALKGELDNLMLFATLFSAIVTAFTIDSYKWLQPNSGAPVTTSVAIQVNVLWFLSLASSLGVASIGILCTQWVRYYGLQEPKPTRRSLALRRQRYKGFHNWHVPGIISLLPVLLQLSLVLFGVGLIRFLWALHHAVGIAFMVASVITIFFVLVTMLAPILQRWSLHLPGEGWTSQCPYQSPQAWFFYLISWWVAAPLRSSMGFKSHPGDWRDFDESWLDLADRTTTTDAENPLKLKSSDIYDKDLKDVSYADRLISEELIWLDKMFSDDLEGIKARAEALRHIPFEAAKYVVGRKLTTYAQRQPPSKLRETLELLKPFKEIGQPRTLAAKDVDADSFIQEKPSADIDRHGRNFKHLRAWYLWVHAQDHPGLDDAYMESRIQFMSEIPRDEIILPALPRASHLDVYCLVKSKDGKDDRLVPRFLHCLKMLIERHKLERCNSAEMWAIIGDLLEYSIRHNYTEYFPELGLLLQAIQQMNMRQALPKEPTKIDTVNHMLEGLESIIELDEVIHPLKRKEDRENIRRLLNLVSSLHSHDELKLEFELRQKLNLDWKRLKQVLRFWTSPLPSSGDSIRDQTTNGGSQSPTKRTRSDGDYATLKGLWEE